MKQIFILEKEELNELKRGESLKILFGDQTITLQADVVRRPSGHELRAPMNGRRGPSKGDTITARVAQYLKTGGPASAGEIAKALGVSPASVSSPLIRGKGTIYKKSGKSRNAIWRRL